jgi:phytoene dehydrogenase-like protein
MLTDALARHFESLGGRIETGREVTQLPGTNLILADVTPRQLLRIAGSELPPGYRRQLERFRCGAGAFKIDYALNSAIPWTANECSRAATVHIGGTLEEIVMSERHFTADIPFRPARSAVTLRPYSRSRRPPHGLGLLPRS